MVKNFYLDIYEHHYELKMKYTEDDLYSAIVELNKMGFSPEKSEIVRSSIRYELEKMKDTSWICYLRYSIRPKKFKQDKIEFYKSAIRKINHYIESFSPLHYSPA